jgi:3-dehydroquinate synthase
MQRLHARLPSRSYDVLVGRGVLEALGAALRDVVDGAQAVVCTDENVAPLYLEPASSSLRAADFEVSHVVIPAGERQKTLERVEEVFGVLYERGFTRDDVLVALGGGVVNDLFGLVAATYLRGMRLAQAPTTLLAQVDAALGGKVAVDFRAGKNHVGTFYQPWLVVADTGTLATLPPRELRSGAAEVVKYGLLAGGALMAELEAIAERGGMRPDDVSDVLVSACAGYKIAVVEDDEREETGRRAVLNLGHTIGHALEVAGGYSRFTHGEAVALGLRATLRLSVAVCGMPPDEAVRGESVLDRFGLPARAARLPAEQVVRLIRRDKKAGRDGVRYVLLEALGAPVTGVSVAPELEEEVVRWITGGAA